MSCRSQVEICVVCEEDHSAPAPGAVGGVAVGEEPQLPAACVYAAKADPLAEVSHELQDVLRKLFVEFIKQTMASSYYSVSLHRGALRQLANSLKSYRRHPGEEDAMINDFGSAVLPELTDIPRLEPQGEWLPRPLQDMLFFHIVHKRPGALHTRPVRDGGQARADECAIAPHIVRHVSLDDHYVLVNLSSVQPGGAFTHQSFLLSLNSLPWKTLIRMTCWELDGDSV